MKNLDFTDYLNKIQRKREVSIFAIAFIVLSLFIIGVQLGKGRAAADARKESICVRE